MAALTLSETAWLRLASRMAATCLVAGVAALMLFQRQPVLEGAGDPSGAISVSMVSWPRPPVAPRTERRVKPPTEDAAPEALTAPASEQAAGGVSGLWFDGAQGRVAFRDGAHYLRCLDARLEKRAEPDCPAARIDTVSTGLY